MAKLKTGMTFKEKISAITQEVTELPVSGYSKKGEYWYDRASEVFPIFSKLFHKYRLLPPRLIEEEKKIVSFGQYPAYELTCWYLIEDIDSQEQERIQGSGLGFNGVWSLDSCRTWALKRALKDRFLAGCPQPEYGIGSDETFAMPVGIAELREQFKNITVETLAGKTASETVDEINKFFEGGETAQEAAETILPDSPAEPLPDMTAPGKRQVERIDYIENELKGYCTITAIPYDRQRLLNAVWKMLNNRWPADQADVDFCKEHITTVY